MPDRPVLTRPPFVAIKPYPVKLKPPKPESKLPQVDLRPTIQSFGLAVRDQGSRGTCSVFAMTFLLEFAYDSQLNDGLHDLSEEYLNYVTNVVAGNTGDGDYFDNLNTNVSNGQWRGWWRILNGVAAPSSGITAVSRDANKLDVFVIGTDSAVWTAAWDANVSSGQWRGWWRIEP